MKQFSRVFSRTTMFLLVIILSTGCSLIPNAELGLKKTELSGNIAVLSSTLEVSQIIPIALFIPDELEDLHKELWSVEYRPLYSDEPNILDQEEINRMMLEAENFEDFFTDEEINAFFSEAKIPIMINNENGEKAYNPKLAILMPEQAGIYHIEVYGYYKSTSPRYVTEIDIEIK